VAAGSCAAFQFDWILVRVLPFITLGWMCNFVERCCGCAIFSRVLFAALLLRYFVAPYCGCANL
jgi:hypothetical protein